jgi:DNA-binding Xre family transcriptional regulator
VHQLSRRELLDARSIKQTELQLRTRLAYYTINDLYHNKTRRVELDTLDVLCKRCDWVTRALFLSSGSARPPRR